MKIGNVQPNVSFKRLLTPTETKEYTEVLSKARDLVNGKDSKSIMVVHDSCLPQLKDTDVGVGHLTSKTSNKFFDFIKTYMGINTVEVLPQGEIQLKDSRAFYNPYNASALSLGTQEIDLELLTTPQYNSILSKEDFKRVVNKNAEWYQNGTKEGLAHYENVIGERSAQETALEKAFKTFNSRPSELKQEFKKFKAQNQDWLEKKAIYNALKKENKGKEWTEWAKKIDQTLFDEQTKATAKRIANIKTRHKKDIDFYMFKQFLADKHLAQGRQTLNEKGMKLFGDCLIGFSQDEVWANKKAFMPGVMIGDPDWKLPALNYETILDSNSASQKLLKRKVELFAKRYDGIRFDCSWCYVEPKLSNGKKMDFGGKILDIIEDTVKKVKGENYNPKNLIHEFEASPEDFSIFDCAKRLKPHLESRVKVITSPYLSKEYGSVAVMDKLGVSKEGCVMGVGNHDPQPLRQIAENIPDEIKGKLSYKRKGQAEVLSEILNLRPDEINTPAKFAKAKFAEPLTGKNQLVFIMDAFGRSERMDAQFKNTWVNYRQRPWNNFYKQYEQAVAEGFGYNPMDAYSKVFKVKGLDKTEPKLYSKIVKFRDILAENADKAVKEVKKRGINISKRTILNAGGITVAALALWGVITCAKSELKKN